MANMKIIEAKTLGSNTASVTFSDIPQTYTDLKIVASPRNSSGGGNIQLKFGTSGGISSTGYSSLYLYGSGTGTPASGSGPTSTSMTISSLENSSDTSNTFSTCELYIPNYTSGNYKSVSADNATENNATTAYAEIWTGLWTGTGSITTIEFTTSTGSFAAGSTFYLYGISNVTTGSKATGGIVSYDSSYYYHTFPYSGTFTPTQSITADYLVVAGGGGGGNNYAGGGGGGGLIYVSGGSLTAQAYTVTVGAGGTVNAAGSNTVFNSQTAVGGGVGGDNNNAQRGGDGGSGGGGAASNTSAYRAGGSPTSGQGYAGGSASTSGLTNWGTGGGGGAGGAGGSGSTTGNGTGGDAGAGLKYFGTWYSNGGLGNGAAILGSPGIGGTPAYTLPTPNTGKGGPHERAGASGVVIIRYAI